MRVICAARREFRSAVVGGGECFITPHPSHPTSYTYKDVRPRTGEHKRCPNANAILTLRSGRLADDPDESTSFGGSEFYTLLASVK